MTPIVFRGGNSIAIIKGAARLILSDDMVVPIDSSSYITRSEGGADSMISFVENKGWAFRGKYGEGYVFHKQKDSMDITISMGSSGFLKYFRLWKTTPNTILF